MTIRFTLDGTVLEGEHTFGEDVAEHLSKVVNALHRSKRCVVVTGAGISVSGGIPDFRSANGLYNLVKDRYPSAVLKGKDLFDASLFRDPITTSVFYTFMAELKQVVSKACPTRTHEFVKSLDKDNKLLRCYTQNIDCLEERLEMCCDMTKKQDLRIVQLHGDLNNVICNMCRTLYPFDDVKRDSFREGTPPSCENCENLQVVRELAGKRAVAVGTLRPNVVLYNEHHTQGDQIAEVAAFDVKKRPDMLIVMGTSLKVVGIKRLVKELGKSVHSAAKPGTVLFINNADVGSHSEWDSVFDYHILGKTDDVVERLEDEVGKLKEIANERAARVALKKQMSDLSNGFSVLEVGTLSEESRAGGKMAARRARSESRGKSAKSHQANTVATRVIAVPASGAMERSTKQLTTTKLNTQAAIYTHRENMNKPADRTNARGRSRSRPIRGHKDIPQDTTSTTSSDEEDSKNVPSPSPEPPRARTPSPPPAPLSPSKRAKNKAGVGSPAKKARVGSAGSESEVDGMRGGGGVPPLVLPVAVVPMDVEETIDIEAISDDEETMDVDVDNEEEASRDSTIMPQMVMSPPVTSRTRSKVAAQAKTTTDTRKDTQQQVKPKTQARGGQDSTITGTIQQDTLRQTTLSGPSRKLVPSVVISPPRRRARKKPATAAVATGNNQQASVATLLKTVKGTETQKSRETQQQQHKPKSRMTNNSVASMLLAGVDVDVETHSTPTTSPIRPTPTSPARTAPCHPAHTSSPPRPNPMARTTALPRAKAKKGAAAKEQGKQGRLEMPVRKSHRLVSKGKGVGSGAGLSGAVGTTVV